MKYSIPALQHLQRLRHTRHQHVREALLCVRDAVFATLQVFVDQATTAGIQGVAGLTSTMYPPDLTEVQLVINHQPYAILASTLIAHGDGGLAESCLIARMLVYRGLDDQAVPEAWITVADAGDEPPMVTLGWMTTDGPQVLLHDGMTATTGRRVAETLLDHWYDIEVGWQAAPTRAMLRNGDPALVTRSFKWRHDRRMFLADAPFLLGAPWP